MKWFIYYNAGSCNDGDHNSGLETFNTRIEAELRLAELLEELSYDPGCIYLIEGRMLD